MEYLNVYDDMGNLLNEKVLRSEKKNLPNGKKFKIILVFIQNSKGEFLIQKVSQNKGGEYATTGGHVQYGSSSLDTVYNEVYEELGIDIKSDNVELYKTINYPKAYVDCYYLKKDIDLTKLNLQESEVESVYYMSVEDIQNLISEDKFRKGNIEPFSCLLDIINCKKI